MDPAGAFVDGRDPRFDHALSVACIHTPEDAFAETTNPLINPDGKLLASGVDTDGVTPLLAWLHLPTSGAHELHILADADGAMPADWDATSSSHIVRTLTARTRKVLVGGSGTQPFYDLFSSGTKAFEIMDASIFHGAILLCGQMHEYEAAEGAYVIRGWGIAMSIDRGQTWALIGDDLTFNTANMQRGWPRGAQYCIRAAPIYQREHTMPESCSFCGSDYRNTVNLTAAGKGRA